MAAAAMTLTITTGTPWIAGAPARSRCSFRGDAQRHDEEERRVSQRRERRRTGPAGLAGADLHGHQRKRCSESVAEVVGTGGEDAERMSEQPDEEQPEDHREIDPQDEAETNIRRHTASMR
jgi:hypothetical protein